MQKGKRGSDDKRILILVLIRRVSVLKHFIVQLNKP